MRMLLTKKVIRYVKIYIYVMKVKRHENKDTFH